MSLKRMDNVGIVVESLDAAISFFTELGLKLEGRAMIEGEWAGRGNEMMKGVTEVLCYGTAVRVEPLEV